MITRETRRLVSGAVLAALAFAVLIALGTWQLERKAWKEDLIARLDDRLAAAPAPLPRPDRWAALTAGDDEFLRVSFSAQLMHEQEALVYGLASSLHGGAGGPGYWVFTPARLADGGIIVVNRGFVPEGRQDPATRRAGQVAGSIEITGVMRWPEARPLFAPADNPARNLWFVRDHRAMAEAKGIAVAPFYIEQESPANPGGLPRVGRLQPTLANNHLQYALTWYGLALALLAFLGGWAASARRAGTATPRIAIAPAARREAPGPAGPRPD